MPVVDELVKVSEEKGDQQVPDVHTVNIGIGGDNNLAVSEVFYPIFYIQCMLQEVEFFIFIDNLLGEFVTI